MADQPEASLDVAWLEALIEVSTLEGQVARLQEAGFLNAAGLSLVLDEAMRLARSDPGKARQLALLCAQVARQAGAPGILPRATYVRGITDAINGELNSALELIESSRQEYEALGDELEALRTNVGRMWILNELGRHAQALAAGQEVLQAFEERLERSPQAKTIAALTHLNQGIIHETVGNYESALRCYDDAEGLFAELQMKERLGDVSNNRAIVLLHLGRISEALAAFENAARIMAEAGLKLSLAQTLDNIGEAHMMLGHFTESLNAFERARRIVEKLDAQANLGIILRKTADAYLALNLFLEAVGLYREALAVIEPAGMSDHRARALWGLGAALVAQGCLEEADSALTGAAALFQAAGNNPMLCNVLLEQSALQKEQGQTQLALHTARRALALVDAEERPIERIYACLRMADLLLPDTEQSEHHLLEALRLSRPLNLPVINHRLDSRFGRLRALQDRVEEAQDHLEAALTQIDMLRGNLSQEASRASFLKDKTAPYEDLILLHLERGDPESVRQAFVVAEQAKSRALLDLISGVISPEATHLQDPEMANHLKSLQADLSATYNRFLDSSAGPGKTDLWTLRNRAAKLEAEISQLRLRAVGELSRPDSLATPFSLEELQAHLPSDLILLAFHILGDEILAFILHREQVEVVRQISQARRVQDILGRLDIQWERFRVGESFVQRNLILLEKSAQRLLAALYEELVAPLESRLGEKTPPSPGDTARVVVVPHGCLHQVPFHALYTGSKYLIERFEISYSLSAAVFTLSQRRKPSNNHRSLVVSVADDLIPGVDAEARAVAGRLAVAGFAYRLLTAEEAKFTTFQAAASGCAVLHLACHGLFRSDNPIFSALRLSDGWLTAADVLNLRLDGALVTLSACESGRNRVMPGDEVIGLPRAFLAAGAGTVVVSLWVVPDETTAELMAHWYAGQQAGMGRAPALRAAQLALMERYPHPYYWAPFVLIGQR